MERIAGLGSKASGISLDAVNATVAGSTIDLRMWPVGAERYRALKVM
jgi:hypothetical protein